MVTPLSVKDADVRFTSWLCRRSREQPSYEHTCESHRVADGTSRSQLALRWPTSSRSPGATRCTGLILDERRTLAGSTIDVITNALRCEPSSTG